MLSNLGATIFTINPKQPGNGRVKPASKNILPLSSSTPLRAPGLSFGLTLNLKNPQTAIEHPVILSSSQNHNFNYLSDDSEVDAELVNYSFRNIIASFANVQISQQDFEEEPTDQDSDNDESAYAMEEDSFYEDFNHMILRVDREETRGDSFLNCRKCGKTFDYSRLSLWVPSYQRTPPRSLQMPNENTHPQIVRCPQCDIENCMACEKSQHDECCSFASVRIVWHALCIVDDAIIQHRKESPYNKDTKSLDAAVIKALNTLLNRIPKDTKTKFEYCNLLRKSMLLDQVAVTIRNMTPANQFDTLCLQSWAFVNMLTERNDLYGLLFEDRLQFLRNMSPGVRVLGFPISFFSVERTYDADRYAPQTYSMWSLIHQAGENADEFLSVNSQLNDSWPAVLLARATVNLHHSLGKKQPSPLPDLISFGQAHQLSSFEARLEEMHRVDGTKYGAVHENTRMIPLGSHFKKQGQDHVEDQISNEEEIGGKRRKMT
ncbi:hypothetical protein EYC80_009134 [Monilinia laxa]|uniref:Uncharacterized protein n=1 Tax=Monilinia laxa TaxID=61186 RepID=A0A5N6K2W4_MONLA|nr:hypothetical protein EYC80_009134 [Monilinia laxa]